jgi:hypothetical protein
LAWGGGLDSTGSGQGPVAGCCECGDEPSGSCATELVGVRICGHRMALGQAFLQVHLFSPVNIITPWRSMLNFMCRMNNRPVASFRDMVTPRPHEHEHKHT